MNGDIDYESEDNYVIVGWFTPDEQYSKLAREFSEMLKSFGLSHYLFRQEVSGDFQQKVCMKPYIVSKAMELFPGKTIILMDIDCIVHKLPIHLLSMLSLLFDVATVIITKDKFDKRTGKRNWDISVGCSTRIVVFCPTLKAKALVRDWKNIICLMGDNPHEEAAFTKALLRRSNISNMPIPHGYSAREKGEVPGAIIEHVSAHRAKAKNRSWISTWLRQLEKRFIRTGRSQRMKTQGA
jgi:hypothetical protein